MPWYLGRRRRNKKDLEVKENSRVKAPKATVKKDHDHTKETTWKKDLSDLKKHLFGKMNKILVRKASPRAEAEKRRMKPKTVRLNGNVWRI